MKKIKFEKWQLIVLSVFYIVFGIISAAVPRENFLTFFNVLGLVIIVAGAFSILIWFLRQGTHTAHSNQGRLGHAVYRGWHPCMDASADHRVELSDGVCGLCLCGQCLALAIWS